MRPYLPALCWSWNTRRSPLRTGISMTPRDLSSAASPIQICTPSRLPATKVMRYLQLENKLRAFQDYDIAKVMPLLQ